MCRLKHSLRLEDRLRGFGPVGVVVAFVIAALGGVGGILVLVWARASKTPWRNLGLSRPRSWVRAVVFGVAVGTAFKLVMKAVVMPLLGAAPENATYHFVAGNTAALPGMIVTLILRAGFGEELMFRGFLFERLGRLIGEGLGAKTAIVLVTSALFGLEHYPDQGVDGAIQALITGLAFGTAFAVTGRLWTVMIAHAAFDLTALTLIYHDVESSVAHVFFRQH
jgi:membrane protease YdiL (CAAX protease family)